MKYHDYHLENYQVFNRGESIRLHLVFVYQGEETDTSTITFGGVALYNFTHTTGVIITDIEEISLADFMPSIREQLVEWNRMHGIKYWKSNFENYFSTLQSKELKVWEITSAIGFYGFVVAKEVSSA